MSDQEPLPLQAKPVASHASTPHPTQQHKQEQSTPVQAHGNSRQRHPERSLRDACADVNRRITRFLSATPADEVARSTQEQTRVAISVIAQALEDYDFSSLSLSYNGGKDCQVLLILYLSVLHTHFTQPSGRRKAEDDVSSNTTSPPADSFPVSIPSIYAKPPDPFDSVTSFVEASTRDYCLDLTHISTNPSSKPVAKTHSSAPATTTAPSSTSHAPITSTTSPDADTGTTVNGTIPQPLPLTSHAVDVSLDPANATDTKPIISFRDAFALYLQTHPSVQAIFVGTRRTDPHGATLEHFQMTDGNWPRFMRIHPVIDWRLSEIWCFLRSEYLADPDTGERLEYCRMYDMGYTSLGGVGDTLRNPRLRYVDHQGQEMYRPAYEMTEDDEERAGRE